jgi:hypothetical protein
MRLTLIARAVVVVAMGAVAVIAPADAGAVGSGRSRDLASERGLATFEGRTIDLQQGWGDAKACHVAEDLAITCYRSERAMDASHGLDVRSGGDYPSAANGYISCGSSLRLYWDTYYSYPVLYLTTRGSWTNLGWFGYDNRISSYKVGSCQSLFRSGNYGAGSTFPGPTYAWARRSTMGWGWDNVLSSIYIY